MVEWERGGIGGRGKKIESSDLSVGVEKQILSWDGVGEEYGAGVSGKRVDRRKLILLDFK